MELKEAIARAIDDALPPRARPYNRAIVTQAALTAISEAGYVLAPKVPTEAMLDAGEYDDGDPQGEWFGGDRLADSYRAMLEAAP